MQTKIVTTASGWHVKMNISDKMNLIVIIINHPENKLKIVLTHHDFHLFLKVMNAKCGFGSHKTFHSFTLCLSVFFQQRELIHTFKPGSTAYILVSSALLSERTKSCPWGEVGCWQPASRGIPAPPRWAAGACWTPPPSSSWWTPSPWPSGSTWTWLFCPRTAWSCLVCGPPQSYNDEDAEGVGGDGVSRVRHLFIAASLAYRPPRWGRLGTTFNQQQACGSEWEGKLTVWKHARP